ncbi:MAG TPA: hypothetical protein EYP10_11305 [Armatimonadetes bacterium]|nr:hypothetical protein [Armatimonadota bacterium]
MLLRALLHIRVQAPEFASGRAIYEAVRSNDDAVMTFARTHDGNASIVAINFSWQTRKVHITAPLAQLGIAPNAHYRVCTIVLASLETATVRGVRGTNLKSLNIDVPPYATVIVMLRRDDAEFPAYVRELIDRTQRMGLTKPLPTQRTGIQRQGGALHIRTRNFTAVVARGVLRELQLANGIRLPVGMDIIEGERKLWWGERFRLTAVRDVKVHIDERLVKFDGMFMKPDGKDGKRMRWEVTYAPTHDSRTLEVHFTLIPQDEIPPVRAQLYWELRFGEVDEWQVETVEGTLRDESHVTHPKGDMMRGWRYWHRSGLLWEHTVTPLNPTRPIISVRKGDIWMHVALPPLLEGIDNAFLRERTSDGEVGLMLCIALLDDKRAVRLSPQIQLKAMVRIAVGKMPIEEMRGIKPAILRGDGWQLHTESVNYIFENEHFQLCIGKWCGGGINWLVPKGKDASLISASYAYSDVGIYGHVRNSLGREVRTRGSSERDFEPDVFIRRTADGVEIKFVSYFRLSYKGWANIARPFVRYTVIYRLTNAPHFDVDVTVIPMLRQGKRPYFLAHVVHLPNIAKWRIVTRDGEREGAIDIGMRIVGRIWQSRITPLKEGTPITLTRHDGVKIAFTNIRADLPLHNLFLHRNQQGIATLFFAFLDGVANELTPLERRVHYRVEIGR